MSSKSLIVPLVLAITLHGLSMQATSQATIDNGACGNLVLVYITDDMVTNNQRANVDIKIQVVGGDFLPSVSLNRGQEYQLKATENNSYTAKAYFGLESAAFDPYVPTRDKGQAAVYWKVNELGFYISYDGSKWKLDTRWKIGKCNMKELSPRKAQNAYKFKLRVPNAGTLNRSNTKVRVVEESSAHYREEKMVSQGNPTRYRVRLSDSPQWHPPCFHTSNVGSIF